MGNSSSLPSRDTGSRQHFRLGCNGPARASHLSLSSPGVVGPRHSPSPPPCKSPVQAESPCQQLYPVVTGTGSLPSPCTRLSSPTLQEPSLSPSGSPFLGPPSPSHSHRHTEAMTYHECQSFLRVVAEGRLARLVIGRLRHSQNTRPHWAAAPPGLEGPPHSTDQGGRGLPTHTGSRDSREAEGRHAPRQTVPFLLQPGSRVPLGAEEGAGWEFKSLFLFYSLIVENIKGL